jgi:ABC-type iron transport system FetAB ATPase subunit
VCLFNFYAQSVLGALLGEMSWSDGGDAEARPPVLNCDAVAYAPQEPFIFDGSLRENVVHFTAPFDDARYRRVLKACALERDLREMKDGDTTLLGSRGFQLSGGQRARVALARACYMDAEVYFADMTFSALDAEVAREVFDATFAPGGILGLRTRVLVTHSEILCEQADHVIRLTESGSISSGPPEGPFLNAADHIPRGASAKASQEASKEGIETAARLVADEMEHAELGAGRSATWYIFFSGLTVPILVGILTVLSQVAVLGLG